MYVTKKNGRVVLYDTEKIVTSVLKANADTAEEELSRAEAAYLANEAFDRLTKEQEIITTQDIRQCVYALLCEMNHPETAKQYADYQK